MGHLPLFGNNLPETFSKWRQKYGDVFRIRMGRWETIVINGHTAIKEAFVAMHFLVDQILKPLEFWLR